MVVSAGAQVRAALVYYFATLYFISVDFNDWRPNLVHS